MTNYDREMTKIIASLDYVPRLILHSCCAPCSTYCITQLSQYFDVTVFFYNPNIDTLEEYNTRLAEQKRLLSQLPTAKNVALIEGKFEPEEYYKTIAGKEDAPERGERCQICYRLRLQKTAEQRGFDYFATTLTLSPLKDAQKINEIGLALQDKYNIKYLPTDFKKREGYKQSIIMSKEYGLYRQQYCGCVFSKKGVKNEL